MVPHYLEWDETLLRLTFEGQQTVEITSTTVSTELVATSPAAFTDHIGDNRGVVLDSPDDPTAGHRDPSDRRNVHRM